MPLPGPQEAQGTRGEPSGYLPSQSRWRVPTALYGGTATPGNRRLLLHLGHPQGQRVVPAVALGVGRISLTILISLSRANIGPQPRTHLFDDLGGHPLKDTLYVCHQVIFSTVVMPRFGTPWDGGADDAYLIDPFGDRGQIHPKHIRDVYL